MSGELYEFEGEWLSVKTIAGKVDLAPSTIYKYLKEGFSLCDAISIGKGNSQKVFKNKPKTNNRKAKKYPYGDGYYTVQDLAKMEGVSEEAIYRKLGHGMKPDEAIQEIKKHISLKYPFRGNFFSIYKISIIAGVPETYLMKKIDSDKNYTEEEIEQIISSYERKVLMVGDTTLFRYCLEHQYNYNVIFYNVKKQGLSIEDAIYQYVVEGQGQRFPSKFVLGNILLHHFFIKEKLDGRYIHDKINRGESIPNAIIESIFLSGETYSNRIIRNQLCMEYLQKGIDILQELLSDEDRDFIVKKHEKIEMVLKHYRLYQAISILSSEISEEDRKLLLTSLQLTEQDLMECSEDIFDGFIERNPSRKEQQPVSYTWRGNFEKVRKL